MDELSPLLHSWESVVMLVLWWVLYGFYTRLLYMYLLVGMFDYKRRYKQLRLFLHWSTSHRQLLSNTAATATAISTATATAATATGDGSARVGESDDVVLLEEMNVCVGVPAVSHTPPLLALHTRANIRTWWSTYQLLKDLGYPFHVRLSVYCGMAIMLDVLLCLVVVIVYAHVATSSAAAPADVGVLGVLLFQISCTSLMLLSMLYYGAQANALSVMAEEAVVQQQVQLQLRKSDCACVVSLLQTLQQLLQLDGQQRPIRVLGLRAEQTFITTVLTGILSITSAIVSALKVYS